MTSPSPHDPYAPFTSTDPQVVDADGTVVAHDGTVVPKGTSSEVLDWVGDDEARAKSALAAEEESGKPRKGVVEALKEIVEK